MKLKIAFVGDYGVSCGVASYNQFLTEELQHLVNIRFFAEYHNEFPNKINTPNDPEWVIRCWDRTDANSAITLASYITSWQPDIVHLQHEPGIIPTALLNKLRERFSSFNCPVIATMHSIFKNSSAFAPYTIVHTQSGAISLKNDIDSKIIVIPHGATSTPELLQNTCTENYTILHPGFMSPYKGYLRMIPIIAKLKTQIPNIKYIIQGSENPLRMHEHNETYNNIMKIANIYGVTDNIIINRGFVSEEELISKILQYKCCVLPYTASGDVVASSGIARVIINTNTPLITSIAHLFEDLGKTILRCQKDADYINAFNDVFNTDTIKTEQSAARIEYLQRVSWTATAQKHYEYYQKLSSKADGH